MDQAKLQKMQQSVRIGMYGASNPHPLFYLDSLTHSIRNIIVY